MRKNPSPRRADRQIRMQSLPRHSRGLTLIEVLVTMVLLGIGLVGLAGLQLRGMQVNQGATFRSQAAILAEDLADRMRVDHDTAKAHTYDANWTANSVPGATVVGPLLVDWIGRLGSLPDGCVVVTTANFPQVTITVTWDDSRAIKSANQAAAAVTGQCLNTAAQTGNGSYVLVTQLADS